MFAGFMWALACRHIPTHALEHIFAQGFKGPPFKSLPCVKHCFKIRNPGELFIQFTIGKRELSRSPRLSGSELGRWLLKGSCGSPERVNIWPWNVGDMTWQLSQSGRQLLSEEGKPEPPGWEGCSLTASFPTGSWFQEARNVSTVSASLGSHTLQWGCACVSESQYQ